MAQAQSVIHCVACELFKWCCFIFSIFSKCCFKLFCPRQCCESTVSLLMGKHVFWGRNISSCLTPRFDTLSVHWFVSQHLWWCWGALAGVYKQLVLLALPSQRNRERELRVLCSDLKIVSKNSNYWNGTVFKWWTTRVQQSCCWEKWLIQDWISASNQGI